MQQEVCLPGIRRELSIIRMVLGIIRKGIEGCMALSLSYTFFKVHLTQINK